MYVCLCHSITDKKIKEEVILGNDTLLSLQKKTQLGTSCGLCLPSVKKILAKEKPEDSNEKKAFTPDFPFPLKALT
jgi:bacterioferritin-associated ferredoxin